MKSITETIGIANSRAKIENQGCLDTNLEKGLQKYQSQLNLEKTARSSGALLRRRGVYTAFDLLRLVFMYSLGDYSLRMVGLWGTVMEVANLSKTAVLNRLRRCKGWLGELIVSYLAFHQIRFPTQSGIRLRLFDASTVSQPGSNNADWRLHLGVDLGRACIDSVHLTSSRQGETLTLWQFQTGDICVADRAYGVPRSLGVLFAAAAWFVIRIGWHNLPMQTTDGLSFDLTTWLKCISTDPDVASQTQVWVNTPQGRFPLRLIGQAIPTAKAEQVRRRIRKEAQRKKRKLDERTILAAGFVLLVSNLPDTRWSANQILDLYQLRWQIELVFKRLKSILHFDHVRAKDTNLAQTYLLAKILAALLIGGIHSTLFELDPEKFLSKKQPISIWRLTNTLFEALLNTIRGQFSLERILLHWQALRRYLSEDSRRRIQQLAAARQFLNTIYGL